MAENENKTIKFSLPFLNKTMPNRMDYCSISYTEPVYVPTQLLFIDCTKKRVAGFFVQADMESYIDYFAVFRPETNSQSNSEEEKDLLIKIRPQILHYLDISYQQYIDQGTAGRLVIWLISDLTDSFGQRMLTELPLDISNMFFWKTGKIPLIIRAGVGGNKAQRQKYISSIQEQYFSLDSFSIPYQNRHRKNKIYNNEYDISILFSHFSALDRVMKHILPLHYEESEKAIAKGENSTKSGMLGVEESLNFSLQWRKLDWFSLTQTQYIPRLWFSEHADILDILDYQRCPERIADLFAPLKNFRREKNWDNLKLPRYSKVMWKEKPYRVTTGDYQTREHLIQFNQRYGLWKHSLKLIEHAQKESLDLPVVWRKLEAISRYYLGQKEHAQKLFASYRMCLDDDPMKSAETYDEMARIWLMEEQYENAYNCGLEAIALDKQCRNAYDALVLAARCLKSKDHEDRAILLAQKNKVVIPIIIREELTRVMRGVQLQQFGQSHKKWWQFWKRK